MIQPIVTKRLVQIILKFSSSTATSPITLLLKDSKSVNGKPHPRNLEQYNIEVQCPELIKFWHPTRNGNLKPSEVSIRSSDKIWWKCSKGPDHEWFACPRSLYNFKTKRINMCPFCDNRKVSVTNSLSTLYPEVAAQWHPSLNGELTPSKILPNSSLVVWWKCENGENHIWKRMVSRRIHPRSSVEDKCPFCCGVDHRSNSLAVCRPDLVKEWDYEKNGKLTPETVSKSSSKNVWWICEKGHHFQATVYNRGSTHNTKCPVCSGSMVTNATRLISYEKLVNLFDFDNNPDIDLSKLSINSKRQLLWKCPESAFSLKKADHKWKCTITEMIQRYHQECPFCYNQFLSDDEIRRLHANCISFRDKQKRNKQVKRHNRIRRYSIEDLDSLLEEMNR